MLNMPVQAEPYKCWTDEGTCPMPATHVVQIGNASAWPAYATIHCADHASSMVLRHVMEAGDDVLMVRRLPSSTV